MHSNQGQHIPTADQRLQQIRQEHAGNAEKDGGTNAAPQGNLIANWCKHIGSEPQQAAARDIHHKGNAKWW